MYAVSENYISAIRARTRMHRLVGTITLTDGTEVPLSRENIEADSVEIEKSCSTGEELQFGHVILTELRLGVRTKLNRYLFFEADVVLNYELLLADGSWETVPLGVYKIGEAERNKDIVSIIAYDSLIALDDDYGGKALYGTPYEILLAVCEEKGMELANTEDEINALPNADQLIQVDETSGCDSWRDCVKVICQMTGTFAVADREGKLLICQYHKEVDAELQKSDRFVLTASDFEVNYIGIIIESSTAKYMAYDQDAETGLEMIMRNAPAWDYGLEETLQARTETLLQELLKIRYTPCELSAVSDPRFDCGTVMFQKNENITDIATGYAYVTLIHYDADTGIATSMYISGKNMIAVTRIRLHTKNWKLTRSLNMVDSTQVLDTVFIEPKAFAGTASADTYHRQYYNFCNSGDGYVWGFEHDGNAAGNSSGKASINWIRINLDDLSYEEGTWEIDGQLYYMGRHLDSVSSPPGYRYSDQSNSVIVGGYLFCFNYSLTGIYKIKLSNITDITFIEHPNKKIMVPGTAASTFGYFYCSSNIICSGNKVCVWDAWLNGDEFVKTKSNAGVPAYEDSSLNDGLNDNSNLGSYPQNFSAGLYGLELGTFTLRFNGYWSGGNSCATTHGRILLTAPYLATINNLPTPVQKTADKTMKITYILREES